jgi:hypothetical protein
MTVGVVIELCSLEGQFIGSKGLIDALERAPFVLVGF